MKHLPTDMQILNKIYNQYYESFASYDEEPEENKSRRSKVHVPIDIIKIGKQLDVDEDIIFGRLYYHLNQKHSYVMDGGSHVDLFSLNLGGQRHVVNFPLVASILSDLRLENRKYRIATIMAGVSLILSTVSLLISTMSN